MKWIRRNIRSGTWLALAALALHLALTFGHIHADLLSPASQTVASTASADGPADDDAAAERYRALRAHHHCAVCASIDQLGTSILPVAQAPALPRASVRTREIDLASIALPHELRASSKARAPPSA